MPLRWLAVPLLALLASACHVYDPALLDAARAETGPDSVDGASDGPTDSAADGSPDVTLDGCTGTVCSGTCVNLTTDPHHCGSCDTDCTALPGVVATSVHCVAGMCDVMGACMSGRAHCSSSPLDGCEADVTTAAQCGACSNACAEPTPLCGPSTGGGYACTDGCGTGFIRCNMTCVDAQNDANNCGSCGHVCPPGTNGSPTCTAATCSLICDANFGNCDMALSNGCERDLQSDPLHCGACGMVCPSVANGTPACLLGVCGATCNAGFGDCDGVASNGCETNLRTTAAHCGSCTNACPTIPNSTAVCSAAVCSVTCNAGFMLVGGSCVLAAPRPVAPLSTTSVTRHRPTFRVALPTGADGIRVEICSDRACTTVVQTADGTGNSVQPATALAPGVYFWRAYARTGSVVASAASIVWVFTVTAHDTGPDTAWGTRPDVNGDGIADVLVGATNAAYLYQGARGPLPTTPTVTLTAPLGATQYGNSVAGAGDVNGDGYGDVVVAAFGSSNVYIYHGGSAGLSRTPSRTLSPPGGSATFGASVAGAGDVNGDGYADVIIGASGSATAYVYHGGTLGIGSSPSSTMTIPVASGGRAVASAGDVNGDGFADVIVGSSGNQARVFLGRLTLGVDPAGPIILTAALVSGLGASVGGAGDVDGDGYADVVVGAPGLIGQAVLFRGGSSGTSTSAVLLMPLSLSPGFGASVDLVPDANGDGFDEVAVGANTANTVWVFSGTATGPSTTSQGLTGPSGFGVTAAGAGDVNGDGFGDLLGGASASATALCFLGAAASPFGTVISLASPAPGNNFGQSLACAVPPPGRSASGFVPPRAG